MKKKLSTIHKELFDNPFIDDKDGRSEKSKPSRREDKAQDRLIASAKREQFWELFTNFIKGKLVTETPEEPKKI